MNYIKLIIRIGVSIIGAIVTYFLGGLDLALKTLLLFMAIDYLTGLICGSLNKKLSSKIAFRGLLKKTAILIIVIVSFRIDKILSADGVLRALVLFFYISLEGISILENSAIIGVPIPEKLKDILLKMNEESSK